MRQNFPALPSLAHSFCTLLSMAVPISITLLRACRTIYCLLTLSIHNSKPLRWVLHWSKSHLSKKSSWNFIRESSGLCWRERERESHTHTHTHTHTPLVVLILLYILYILVISHLTLSSSRQLQLTVPSSKIVIFTQQTATLISSSYSLPPLLTLSKYINSRGNWAAGQVCSSNPATSRRAKSSCVHWRHCSSGRNISSSLLSLCTDKNIISKLVT